jgi:hypothetical protein
LSCARGAPAQWIGLRLPLRFNPRNRGQRLVTFGHLNALCGLLRAHPSR